MVDDSRTAADRRGLFDDDAVLLRVSARRRLELSTAAVRRRVNSTVVRRPGPAERPSRSRLVAGHGRSTPTVAELLQVHTVGPTAVHATSGGHVDDGGSNTTTRNHLSI